jgi:hypothetical protein
LLTLPLNSITSIQKLACTTFLTVQSISSKISLLRNNQIKTIHNTQFLFENDQFSLDLSNLVLAVTGLKNLAIQLLYYDTSVSLKGSWVVSTIYPTRKSQYIWPLNGSSFNLWVPQTRFTGSRITLSLFLLAFCICLNTIVVSNKINS